MRPMPSLAPPLDPTPSGSTLLQDRLVEWMLDGISRSEAERYATLIAVARRVSDLTRRVQELEGKMP